MQQSSLIPVDDGVASSWAEWIAVTKERCHLNFALTDGNLAAHIAASLASSTDTARRIAADLGRTPLRILEVGCSTGFNCMALARLFPNAQVHGIEPDAQAVRVGQAMVAASGQGNVHLAVGVGEHLPYAAAYFDLIVCHTVIEHVQDVEAVISEMARVLSTTGMIHLEAPNYIWPYEPHLEVVCIPLMGKRLLKWMARLQGKGGQTPYVDHLQLVTPFALQRMFDVNGLTWRNRVPDKVMAIVDGDAAQIKQYRRLGRLIAWLFKVGLGAAMLRMLIGMGLYPSVLYSIEKR